jgi:hypothetical protein
MNIIAFTPISTQQLLPAADIPQHELSQQYDNLAEKYKALIEQNNAILFLYQSATMENKKLQTTVEESIEADIRFSEGHNEGLEAVLRENTLLKAEITVLKSQQRECKEDYDTNSKSAQDRIIELEKEVALQRTENERLKNNEGIVARRLNERENKYRAAQASLRTDIYSPYTLNFYTKINLDELNEMLELQAILSNY